MFGFLLQSVVGLNSVCAEDLVATRDYLAAFCLDCLQNSGQIISISIVEVEFHPAWWTYLRAKAVSRVWVVILVLDSEMSVVKNASTL